jgi:hypothetical protein
MFRFFLGPWDEKTGVFAPLYHQSYQVESESLRNVVRKSIQLIFFIELFNCNRMDLLNYG